jgi:preprotein translocase subunit SecE
MSESDNNENETEEAANEAADSGASEEAIEKVSAHGEEAVEAGDSEVVGQEGAEEADLAAGHIGVQRYVHAAFFASGILAAYLSGKVLLSAWNTLADWPEAVRSLPLLIEYTEDERASLTLVIGAVVGVLLVLRYYRRPAVRSWATDVASELSRVTWPDKETVTNGTIVVLVAGAIATLYIALLDRLWGYLTNLIYGA